MPGENEPSDALARAEAAAKRIDEWRSHLLKLAAGSIPEIEETSFLGREMRAAATVATMAELEALLRDMLISVGAQVNSTSVQVCDLVPTLRSLVAHSHFVGIAETASHDRTWEYRLAVTQMDNSTDVAQLPVRLTKSAQPPLDGRTIQPRHLTLVWQVLGITEEAVPKASVVVALRKLTLIRNDVAHRNVDIYQVFSEAGRTAAEIANYLDEMVLLVLHVGHEWDTYISERAYLVKQDSPVISS